MNRALGAAEAGATDAVPPERELELSRRQARSYALDLIDTAERARREVMSGGVPTEGEVREAAERLEAELLRFRQIFARCPGKTPAEPFGQPQRNR